MEPVASEGAAGSDKVEVEVRVKGVKTCRYGRGSSRAMGRCDGKGDSEFVSAVDASGGGGWKAKGRKDEIVLESEVEARFEGSGA